MNRIFACAGLAFALTGFSGRADAAPITYQISGTGSGQIGSTTFTNALVTFTGTGDTDNVVAWTGALGYANPFTTLTVNIAGIATATVTEPSEIISIPNPIIDDDLPPLPVVIFGRTDNPPDLDSFTGMGAVGSNSLLGYDLRSSIGPITEGGGVGFIDQCSTPFHDPCLATTLGLLSFTTNISVDGEGTFSATVQSTVPPQPVPEPTTLLLVGGGLTALARRRFRHV